MKRSIRRIAAFGMAAVGVGAAVSVAQDSLKVAARYLVMDGVNQGRLYALRTGRDASDPIRMQLGVPQSKVLMDWINLFLADQPVPRTAQIVTADADYKALGAQAIEDALISEVSFPALDGSSKDPCYMSITVAPERSRQISPREMGPLPTAPRQALWTANNFRFELGSLPCRRVTKIEGFAVKQATRLRRTAPSSFAVTFAAADGAPWAEWARDFAARGSRAELGGSIAYLGRDPSTELLRVELVGVGIAKLDKERDATGRETGRLVAHLEARRMRLGRR